MANEKITYITTSADWAKPQNIKFAKGGLKVRSSYDPKVTGSTALSAGQHIGTTEAGGVYYQLATGVLDYVDDTGASFRSLIAKIPVGDGTKAGWVMYQINKVGSGGNQDVLGKFASPEEEGKGGSGGGGGNGGGGDGKGGDGGGGKGGDGGGGGGGGDPNFIPPDSAGSSMTPILLGLAVAGGVIFFMSRK
jgi:hypothetical protein